MSRKLSLVLDLSRKVDPQGANILLQYVFTKCIENSHGLVSKLVNRSATELMRQPEWGENTDVRSTSINGETGFQQMHVGTPFLEHNVHIL